MLSVNNIEVVYSDVILVLRGISLAVEKGQIVSLLGANGAGKTTTLKSISGLLLREDGAVTRGGIEFDGQRLDKLAAEEITRLGIVQVLEGRRLFQHLTTEENLLTGALIHPNNRAEIRRTLEQVYTYFPALPQLRNRTAGYLSGGEQQMVAIGRALMSRPRLMLLDEPSLGLAPLLVQSIFEMVRQYNEETGVSILLVEQNANVALQVADYAYVMENGRIVLDGSAEQLAQNADIKEFYLGLTSVGERKSYRDVKHYKRRKRWLG
ncbi:MAG: ABC transporter ATP-binding protein [Ardenticatenaceae bacterium]|nr:ABC transporter ATP-binding protein [Anaerolineales bacterium]MCB8922488.1 ABC transporter ATP-binding protein [Ardenticatenaceae bacterium]MCB8989957.1 ABC transporter ATP-binding protein [Ardenticatenaceae bacterium]MCB9005400.1 ABC transporter ATP-binding protein [Ardenticatenaceae bacterium]